MGKEFKEDWPPVQRDQVKHLFDLANQRDRAHFAWLRHLLLLASGALTLLVSLKAGHSEGSVALWSMRIAWVSLGLGILLLAFSAHAEIWLARALVKALAEETRLKHGAAGPVVVNRPLYYVKTERGAYLCLTVAVVALVCYGVTSTF